MSNRWMLRHGESAAEQGPFTLNQIVDAAAKGHLVAESQLLHPHHSKGQWVAADRVPAVRTARQAALAASPPAAPPPQAQPSIPAVPPVAQFQDSFPGTPPSGGHTDAAIDPEQLNFSPRVRRRRLNTNRFSVPKTPGAAVMALFDFRFRHFVTPWIIKFVWAVTVALVVLGISAILITQGVSLLPSTPAVELPETEVLPTVQFVNPFRSVTASLLRYVFLAWWAVCVLLSVRVFLELAIVVFRIAEDISQINAYQKHRDD